METECRIVVVYEWVGWQGWVTAAYFCRLLFWSVENVLKLDFDDGHTKRHIYGSIWYLTYTSIKL